jgi:hypothetical protein
VSFAVASQQVFIVVYFVIDLVRQLLDTASYPSNFIMNLASLLSSPNGLCF